MWRGKNLILLPLAGNEDFARKLASRLQAETGKTDLHSFPDGETYVRILSDVEDKIAVLVCSLQEPDEKFLPLYFLVKTARAHRAKHVCLVAPYLAYMRQDKAFHPGEGVTSEHFGELISSFVDSLVTCDPHLHRRSSLAEIYSIPAKAVHAAGHISNWIKENLERPVLVGPDGESEQWVSEVARNAGAPYIVLQKKRRGDRDVEISPPPQVEKYRDYTPVLVDDIISTAGTMVETVKHLKTSGMKPPVCIGVHAVFAGSAYEDLLGAGAQKIVTCNTIPHISNDIDVSALFIDFINSLK